MAQQAASLVAGGLSVGGRASCSLRRRDSGLRLLSSAPYDEELVDLYVIVDYY